MQQIQPKRKHTLVQHKQIIKIKVDTKKKCYIVNIISYWLKNLVGQVFVKFPKKVSVTNTFLQIFCKKYGVFAALPIETS